MHGSKPRTIMIRENRIIIALLSIICVIAFGMVLYQIRSIILPFALAVFISFILNPVIGFFEKRRVPTFFAIILALVFTFLVLNFFGVLAYTSIKSFAEEFPKYEQRLRMLVDQGREFLNIPSEVFEDETRPEGSLKWLNSIRELSLHRIVLSTLGSLVNFMSNTFLVLLFLLFILIGRNNLGPKIKSAFEPEISEKISQMIININSQIQKYLIAKTFISLFTAILFYIVLTLFNVQFAIIWGILTFLLNFIPNIGSVIATLLPLSIAFIQFESYGSIVWLAILLVLIQLSVGNFMDPRIVGRSLNLSPLMVLFSLIFWGWLWGIIGMFLAVPISVIIKIIFENIESLRFISVMMSSK
jgi:AI-2 transport protein TqsA